MAGCKSILYSLKSRFNNFLTAPKICYTISFMSQHLISRYLNELSDLRRVSGEARESVVSEAFKTLLKDWGRSKDLIFVPEYKLARSMHD
jgi:hypothetical protein